jgi:hypothetical protein
MHDLAPAEFHRHLKRPAPTSRWDKLSGFGTRTHRINCRGVFSGWVDPVYTIRRHLYAVGIPNGPRTPPSHGTPTFTLAPRDWAFYVAAQQRKLVLRTVPRGSAVPSPQELAEVIRKHAAPKRTAVRELIDAAQAVADAGDISPPYLRLRTALAGARKQFG